MTQPWPVPPPVRARNWPAIALAVLAVAIAVVALVLELTRSGAGSKYTTAERSAAKTELCEHYKLAAQAVHIETNNPDNNAAFARIATTNGALMLYSMATNPALDTKYREAARELADEYQNMTVLGSQGMATTEQYQSLAAEAAAKERVMQELCGG